MKNITLLIFLALLSCNKTKENEPNLTKDKFVFSTWANTGKEFNQDAWAKKLADYKDLGISEILVSGSPENLTKLITLAQKSNIKIHAWMWTLNRPGDSIAKKILIGMQLTELVKTL